MTISYDGTDYNGFQKQPRGITVQGELEKVIESLVRHPVTVYGSGRTDAGVHARTQVIHFRTDSPIPVERWALALNSRLPESIVIRDVQEAKLDFHARLSAKRKTYRYALNNSLYPDVFQRRYQWHISRKMDEDAMFKSAEHFLGTQEFTSFSSSRTATSNHIRTIYRSEWVREGDVLFYYVEGNGFLYNMVRILVGTMIHVGDGKIKEADIPEIIMSKNRKKAGPTAPAAGLTLWNVEY